MKKEIKNEFGARKPRAIVLDDHPTSRTMTARALRKRGFVVEEVDSFKEFERVWKPGMVDLVVADWQLSERDHGDIVLKNVRKRDWDVPFVLVSGKLGEDERRVKVLEVLLKHGAARFVTRGSGGIAKACDEGEDLIERRDLTLLKTILALREAALNGQVIQSSNGPVSVAAQLAELVAEPKSSHEALGSVSKIRSDRALSKGRQ